MKKRLHFEVHGFNNSEVERRALRIVADYLEVEPEEVERLCDLEIEVRAKSPLTEEDEKIVPTPTFLGTVFVRVK
jgi:hypothetical protein